jgi:DNA-binding CsgD family transcriptional regulator
VEAEESTTVELLNYRADGDLFWNHVKVAPIRDDAGEVTHFAGFQMDVTERKQAELAVRRDRANLDHLLDRIDGLFGDVTQTVRTAKGRSEIERRVCEHVATTDSYAFAWIGDVDVAEDVIRPHAWSGADHVAATDLAVPLAETDHPAVRAYESGSLQVLDGNDAASFAVLPDIGGVAAVPLTSGGWAYGVLLVYALAASTLDDRETAVLESLGRTVATALSAHESRQFISANHVVSVELVLRDRELFFVDLSARVDCTLEYRGSVSRGETELLFFTADAEADAVLAATESVPGIEHAAVVGDESGTTLFEFRPTGASLVSELAGRGARTQTISATDGTARLAVELPTSVDVRSVVEAIQAEYADTELVGYHETERPPTTERNFVAELEDRLTERQLTVLQKAYLSGYYDSSRAVTGEELAESMGVSRATVHQHRRAAERKLLEAFLDP